MYVNYEEFNRLVDEKDLWIYTISIVDSKSDTIEMSTKYVLGKIKDFNSGKNVIFTCVKCHDDDNDIYKDTAWKFAYETNELRDELLNIMQTECGCYDSSVTFKEGTVCPFMNVV